MHKLLLSKCFFLIALSTLSACSQTGIAPETENPSIPADWVRGGAEGAVNINWLDDFSDSALTALVTEAVDSNYQINQERARLYQAEQTVIITRANRFPTLNVSLDASRRFSQLAAGINALPESFSLSSDARWEVDLWGRLSKQQQAAQLLLLLKVQ